MNPVIHRQFDSKAHEHRFRSEMIKAGYSPKLVDQTISAINRKKFFTEPRNVGPLNHFGVTSQFISSDTSSYNFVSHYDNFRLARKLERLVTRWP